MNYKDKVIALLNSQELSKEQKEKLENIFPELRESEDERIREQILDYIIKGSKSCYDIQQYGKENFEKWITWLEKQVPINEEAEKEKDDYVSDQFLYCKGSFNEFKEGESYWIEYIGSDTYIGRSDNILNQKFHITPRQLYTWLDPRHPEKQGEQKPFDYENVNIQQKDFASKVEPKFHEGDWVVQGCSILKIKCVGDTHYCFETVGGYVDDMLVSEIDSQFHLWTIQDAKDGDVLVNWNNTVFIFKIIEDETVKFHIAYNKKWDIIKTPSTKLSHLGLPEPQFEFQPATKEQRDDLFTKMREAGYEWDAEKKELKNIEQKPTDKVGNNLLTVERAKEISPFMRSGFENESVVWSEDDKKRVDQICDDLRCGLENFRSGKNVKGLHFEEIIESNIVWLKELSERIALQQKQEWSEEDERNASYICAALECYYRLREERNNTNGQEDLDKARNWLYNKLKFLSSQNKWKSSFWSEEDKENFNLICFYLNSPESAGDKYSYLFSWLKSLNPQNRWKPSDEQMDMLKISVSTSNSIVLDSLYNDLKKLSEE